jgi:hypothetical protein
MEYTRLAAATIVSAPGAGGVGTASAGSAGSGQAVPRGDDGAAPDVAAVSTPAFPAARLTGPARVAPSRGGVTAANRAW